MSRGRKKNISEESGWESLSYKFQGSYFQYAIHHLGQKSGKKIINTPFPIPENWQWKTLGDVVELTENLNIEAKLAPNTLIHYVDIDAIDNNQFRIREAKLKTVSELSSRARRVLKKGYFMYSLVRPYLNNLAIVEEDKDYYIGSTGFAVFKSDQLLNPFIKLWLLSDYVRNRFLEMISGFNSPSITMQQFLSTWIPVAPMDSQIGLLDFFDAFQKKQIEGKEYFDSETEKKLLELHESQLAGNQLSTELTHQLNLVKQLRQAFLREAMQGKLVEPSKEGETGQQLLAKIKAEKAQLIAAKKLKKEKDLPPIKPEEIPGAAFRFDIPEHWTWCRLGDICTKIGSGSTPKGSNYSKEGKPFFRSQNIYNEGLIYDDISFISDEVHQQMNGTVVYSNDILLNITGGSMGRCAIVPSDFEEGNVSQHVCIIRPLSVNNQYVHKLVLSPDFQKLIFNSTTGAGREGLPKYNLERFPIPLPPLSEQQRIVEKLESLMQTCDALEESIKAGQRQNEQLLQQVLREALKK